MATVESRTRISIDELVEDTVVSGYVADGFLILVNRGGAEIFAGAIGGGGAGGGGGQTVVVSSPELFAGVWSADIVHGITAMFPNITAWNSVTKELEILNVKVIDENTIRIRADEDYPAATYQLSITGNGDPVPPGEGEFFLFEVPTNPWVCHHTLSSIAVSVTCRDEFGTEIEGDVAILDENTVQISWGDLEAGSVLIQE